jgi:hypothetical protein
MTKYFITGTGRFIGIADNVFVGESNVFLEDKNACSKNN